MKRNMKCSSIIIISCIFLLTGCTTNQVMPESESSYSDKVVTSTSDSIENSVTKENNNFRIYTDLTNSITDFDKEILGNQIDKDYNIEFNQATTTQEFVDVQNKYIDKWKDDMQNTIIKLKVILNENDFNYFKFSQDEWEKQLLDSTKSDRNIIENSQYEIMVGSSFKWMWLSNIREQYRERTFHIKYLLNLLQNKGDE